MKIKREEIQERLEEIREEIEIHLEDFRKFEDRRFYQRKIDLINDMIDILEDSYNNDDYISYISHDYNSSISIDLMRNLLIFDINNLELEEDFFIR